MNLRTSSKNYKNDKGFIFIVLILLMFTKKIKLSFNFAQRINAFQSLLEHRIKFR